MSGEVKNDDGGPAFPCDSTNKQFPTQCGMSLRDWFAGQALDQRKMLSTGAYYAADAAREAYEIADAMLKTRSGK